MTLPSLPDFTGLTPPYREKEDAIANLDDRGSAYVPMFSGSNFSDDKISRPLEGANCNVAFPASWSHWRCAMWRMMNDCPGCGWTYERGFITVGVPTLKGQLTAAVLNRIFANR